MIKLQRVLLVTLGIFGIYSSRAQSKIYHPFPDSNAVWSNFNQYEYQPEGYNLYSIIGDTLINSITYQKLYIHYENDHSPSDSIIAVGNSTLLGGIREDSLKRIYFHNISYGKAAKDSTYKLYDFSAKVGDTIFFGKFPSAYTFPNLVLISVDSVLVKSQFRKRLNLSADTWIEGIGSTRDLLSEILPILTCTCINELICYKYNNETNYLNPLFPDCFPFTGEGVMNYNPDENISLYPNPAQDKITLELATEGKYNLVLTNTLGQQLGAFQFTGTRTELNVADYPKGVYFVQVSSDQGKTVKKIVIQ